MRYIALILGLMIATAGQSFAQKFGYINSNELLSTLPEVKTAETTLETFQKSLEDEGQALLSQFEKEYLEYMEQMNEGLLSKVQMAEREQKLTADQQVIAQFEQNAQQRLAVKRQEVLEPILERVDEAIQAYGKANSYTFIFDSSGTGGLLHAPEGDDITDQIKAELSK